MNQLTKSFNAELIKGSRFPINLILKILHSIKWAVVFSKKKKGL